MSLAKKAVLGALWSITSSIGARAVGLVSTLILTRYVAPDAYGAVSVATVVVLSFNLASTLGVGHYLVAFPKSGRDYAFQATVMYLAAAVVAFGIAVALRHSLADAFEAPDVAVYLPYILGAFCFTRLGGIPTRILVREMRFKVLGLSQVAAEFGYSITTLALAVRGHGAMSLVWGTVVREFLLAAVVIFAVHPKEWLTPSPLRREEMAKMLKFGLPFSASGMLDIIARRWDNLLFARLFGPAAVGTYNLAYNLADVPASQVGEHIGDVLLPSFSKMDDVEARKRALARAGGLLALVVFPLAIGLGAVADTLVDALFDESWQGIAPMLVVLSSLSVVRPLGWLLSSYLLASARTGRIFVLQLCKASGIVGFIYALSPLGEVVACAGVGAAFLLYAVLGVRLVKAKDGIKVRTLVMPMLPPLLACTPMVACVLGIRPLLIGLELNVWLRVVLEVAAGGSAYVVSTFVVAKSQTKDVLQLLKHALRRGG